MSDQTSEPMSDERLAEIRAMLAEIEAARDRLTGVMGPSDRPRAPVLIAAHDLLAEVERLRGREEAAILLIASALLAGEASEEGSGDGR